MRSRPDGLTLRTAASARTSIHGRTTPRSRAGLTPCGPRPGAGRRWPPIRDTWESWERLVAPGSAAVGHVVRGDRFALGARQRHPAATGRPTVGRVNYAAS